MDVVCDRKEDIKDDLKGVGLRNWKMTLPSSEIWILMHN